MRSVRAVVFAWAVLYPVLPPGPLLAFLIASALGPPYVVGFDGNGWPVLGPITPSFVFVALIMPWALTSIGIAFVAGVLRRGTHQSGN